MKRRLFAVVAVLSLGLTASAADKGTIEVAGLKGTTPEGWKEEKPASTLRLKQYKLEKAQGDSEDAELAVFVSRGGGGIDANLKRQEAKFKFTDGAKKDDAVKVSESKVGTMKASYQDIKGTYVARERPGDPSSKATDKKDFRQLYVICEDDEKTVISFILVGPQKTVEKHKKDFDAFIASFKK